MSHRNGHPMYGSARARWMAELEDLINMQRVDGKLTEAAARRVYGDDFVPPDDEGDRQLAGGDIKYEVHNHLPGEPGDIRLSGPVVPRRPKSTTALLGAVLILSLAIVAAAWLISGRRVPSPSPTKPANPGGYGISIFEP